MSDLISRQAAIDAVEGAKTAMSVDGEIYCAKINAQMNIQLLPAAQADLSSYSDKLWRAAYERGKAEAQCWIPCSEQLPPEEKKTYWVCTDNGHQHECRWTNANPIWTNLTKDWHWNIFDIPQYTKVVAWMELPKPYEGGEQDEH